MQISPDSDVGVRYWVVDAFTRLPFKGNPAAVCLLPHALDDALMQAIAAEMNLSETAFVMPIGNMPWCEAARFSLRWFTPKVEVRLCGHATLATAAVLFGVVGVQTTSVTFETLSGDLIARRVTAGPAACETITLDFPADTPVPCEPPTGALKALGVASAQAAAYGTRAHDLLIHLADAQQVRDLRPDFAAMLASEDLATYRGVMVTAVGEPPYDFVSRFFAPKVGINEDPVTGSAHTLLTPYWAAQLGKAAMLAYQASARGGEIGVRLAENGRVELRGDAVVVFKGELCV
ncbi:MAG: PhzF family phenazine biosynthesis isomerase [Anaerolineae bacterium]